MRLHDHYTVAEEDGFLHIVGHQQHGDALVLPDALQLALVENLQRADLTPIDEATGYRRLMSDFNQTQEQVAETVGKSRPHIANTLRLLDLPQDVRELVHEHKLSAGIARTLLAFADPSAMADRAIQEKLTVRDLEALAREAKTGERPAPHIKKGKAKAAVGSKTSDTRALEKRIEEALGDNGVYPKGRIRFGK